MRGSSGARTSWPARTAAMGPGSARQRSTPTWYGRSSARWPKARGSHHVNSGRRSRSASAQFDSVAHLTEACIGLRPAFRARHADDVEVRAAAEAQPLHDCDLVAGRAIAPARHDLMALLAADAQRFRRVDADFLHVGNGGEHLMCEAL